MLTFATACAGSAVSFLKCFGELNKSEGMSVLVFLLFLMGIFVGAIEFLTINIAIQYYK